MENHKIDYIALSLAFFLFVFSAPFFFWGILGNNYLKLLLRIIFLILLSKRIASIDAIGKFQFFLFETTVVLSLFLDLFKGSSNVNGIIEQIPLLFYVMIFLLDGKSLMKVGNYLTTIVSIVFVASLISYLGSIIGFTPQLGTIEHYSQNRSYVHYPFFLFEVGELSLRFYGIYDEPGQLGTISALLLCANSFNFKDWRTWILLTSGILSLSLFFYVTCAICLVFYFLVVRKNLFIALIATAVIAVFYNTTKDDATLAPLLWERLEYDSESGKIAGDNRMTVDADYAFDKIKGTGEYWFGVRDVSLFQTISEGSSSYKGIIASKGMVFFLLYTLFFVLLAFKKKVSLNSFLLFSIIFIFNMFQRTNVYGLTTMFIYAYLAMKDKVLLSINSDNEKDIQLII